MARQNNLTSYLYHGMNHPEYKIAYIIDELVGPYAGTEKQLLSLINGIKQTDFIPHLIVLRSTRYLEENDIICPTLKIGLFKLFHPKTIKCGFDLYMYLRNNNISLVHIFFNDASIFAPIFCKLAGAKVIISRRDLGFWCTPFQRVLMRVNKIFIDSVIVNSTAVKDYVRRNEGYSAERVEIINNGHDLKLFDRTHSNALRKKFRIPDNAPIVGMVANFHMYKRHEDLIDAFSLIHNVNPEAHLVFIGDGDCFGDLKNKSRQLGLIEYVHFAGRLEQVIPAIHEFTVCVLCSETEGLPNALIEYMACAKPVVATNVGGNVEIINDNINGILVEPRDSNGLANRILSVLNNRELAKRLGDAGRKTVEQKFSLERMISSHISIYQDLLN